MTISALERGIIKVFGMPEPLPYGAELAKFGTLALSEDRVAPVAIVGLDGALSVLRLVPAIVTPKAARPIPVANVVRVIAPRGLHLWEKVVRVDPLNKLDRPSYPRIIPVTVG